MHTEGRCGPCRDSESSLYGINNIERSNYDAIDFDLVFHRDRDGFQARRTRNCIRKRYDNNIGTTTNYVPITVHRSDYGAIYFIKQRSALGIIMRDLTDAERQELQTNKGAAVRLIVDGTPAFDADILVGDVITGIDGVAVSSAQTFRELLRERRGRLVSLSIVRRGQHIEKAVQLNP